MRSMAKPAAKTVFLMVTGLFPKWLHGWRFPAPAGAKARLRGH